MKRIFRNLVCVAAVLFPLALAAYAPYKRGPFTLTLQAPKRPLKSGRPLILFVIVANSSDHHIHVPISQGTYGVEKIYHLHVLDERGLPPPRAPLPKPKGFKGVIVIMGSEHGTGLEPGKSLTDELNISHVYDLGRPGRYKVWIAERFGLGPNDFVRSNTVTVTVVK